MEPQKKRGRFFGVGAKLRQGPLQTGKVQRTDGSSGSSIPPAAIPLLLERLVAALEPAGVWGPGLVARDLANCALVSRDWRLAAKQMLPVFGNTLQDIKITPDIPGSKGKKMRGLPALQAWAAVPGSVGWEVWDRVVSAPEGLTLDQLKAAARVVGSQASGTRANIEYALLKALDLRLPLAAPAVVIRAVCLEDDSWGGRYTFASLHELLDSLLAFDSAERLLTYLEAAGVPAAPSSSSDSISISSSRSSISDVARQRAQRLLDALQTGAGLSTVRTALAALGVTTLQKLHALSAQTGRARRQAKQEEEAREKAARKKAREKMQEIRDAGPPQQGKPYVFNYRTGRGSWLCQRCGEQLDCADAYCYECQEEEEDGEEEYWYEECYGRG